MDVVMDYKVQMIMMNVKYMYLVEKFMMKKKNMNLQTKNLKQKEKKKGEHLIKIQ